MANENENRPKESFRLPKSARLRHRNVVLRLFAEGHGLYVHPLRMTVLVEERDRLARLFRGNVPPYVDRLQMMVTIPKKKFRHAVDRVLLRRRIKEAYRLHRAPLAAAVEATPGKYMHIAFTYVGNEIKPYASLEKRVKKLLEKAAAHLQASLCTAVALRYPVPPQIKALDALKRKKH